MPAFSEPVENPMIRMEPEPTVPELPHPGRLSGFGGLGSHPSSRPLTPEDQENIFPDPFPPSSTEVLVRKVGDPWGPIGQADGADGFDTPPNGSPWPDEPSGIPL